MKRVHQDVAGRPFRGKSRAAETGPTLHSPLGLDVASFLDSNPARVEIDEFAEFLGLETVGSDASNRDRDVPPDADPVFRERLRRRLWQVHQLTQLKRNSEPH